MKQRVKAQEALANAARACQLAEEATEVHAQQVSPSPASPMPKVARSIALKSADDEEMELVIQYDASSTLQHNGQPIA